MNLQDTIALRLVHEAHTVLLLNWISEGAMIVI